MTMPIKFEKKTCLAVLDHSRDEAARFLNHLHDLTIQANGILEELSPNSVTEKEIITATLKDLESGEEKYTNTIDEFDASSSQIIEQTTGEVNRGHSGMPPPPPPAPSGPKYIKHDKLMPEVLVYNTSPVEFETWARLSNNG